MIDIVFPKNNEKEFLATAERLGQQVAFAYPKKGKGLTTFEVKVDNKPLILWKATEQLRAVIEKSPVDIIYGLEELSTKDFIHHRASGLNQVLCKLLHKKDKAVGFSFSSLLKAAPIKRAQIMGRMQQNFRLCKKYKVRTIIASFAEHPYEMRGQQDLSAFFRSIGMDLALVKNSFALLIHKASSPAKNIR